MHEKKFGAFLSHAHADKAAVDRLYAWLSDVAGVQVWYDALNMPPGSEISSFLPAAILDSRACILILSESSIRSGWVKKEHGVAEKHQTTFPAFRILPFVSTMSMNRLGWWTSSAGSTHATVS